MGTFADAINAAVVKDNWCAPGMRKLAGRAKTPQEMYDTIPNGSSFLQYLNITNHAKCQTLFKQSLCELAALLPASDAKTNLASIGGGTADLESLAASEVVTSMTRSAAKYVLGTDTVYAFTVFRRFARAWGKAHGGTFRIAEPKLVVLWKSRCSAAAFANNLA